MTPMRTNIVGPPRVATRIHSGLPFLGLVLGLWEFLMCLPASSRVTTSAPAKDGLCNFHPRFAHGNYGFAILRNRSSLQQSRTLINVALTFFERFFSVR